MKKILSILLAAAMLVTTLVVFALPTSAATQGEWSVYTAKSQDLGLSAVLRDIPGYQYTEEGLKMIPGEWENSTPYATFQTTNEVDISLGVYLRVRVDDFSYDAGDSWFGFSFWDQENVELGNQGDEYGYGVETLIRVNKGTESAYDQNDKNTWPGSVRSLEWYKDLEEGNRVKCTQKTTEFKKYENEFDENGKPIITIEVRWDEENECCTVFVNNSPAPDEYNQALNSYFESKNYSAYVGFSIQNSKLGGTVACTILEYGIDKETAVVPQGEDSKAPEIFSNEYGDMIDSSTVPAGRPAVLLTGGSEALAIKPTSVQGNKIVVNDDNSINVSSNTDNMASVMFRIHNDITYEVKDFPAVLIIVRNFCTCTYIDIDYDDIPDEVCSCLEKINTLALAGEVIADDSKYSASSSVTEFATFVDNDGNEYLYFIADWSDMTAEGAENHIEGRIHGVRIDVSGMKGTTDPERNNFDICEVGFFRDSNEAKAYFFDDFTPRVISPEEETTTVEETTVEETTVEETTVEETTVEETTVEETTVEETTVEETTVEETTVEETTVEETTVEETTVEETTVEETTVEETTVEETTVEETTVEETTVEETTVAETTAKETETTPVEKPTETEKTTETEEAPAEAGCSGVVGVGAIAVVALAAAGLISFKKKED